MAIAVYGQPKSVLFKLLTFLKSSLVNNYKKVGFTSQITSMVINYFRVEIYVVFNTYVI